jgi:hypothetical protein
MSTDLKLSPVGREPTAARPWGEGGRQLAPFRLYVPVSYDYCFSTMSPFQGDIVVQNNESPHLRSRLPS